ncbi:MAG: CheY-like chemotaxis protein, partial [Myxococcota bacterium]
MRLLVVDADRRLGELIRSVAVRDGHQVWVAESAAQALVLGERHQPEVILGALELGDESGLAPLRTLRDTLAKTPDIILSSATRSRYDPRVQAAMDALQARDFFRQPLSVLDLMDMLRQLAAPAPGAVPQAPKVAPTGRVLGRSLVKLTQIWSGRLSGMLSFTDSLRTRRELPFSDGGPVRRGDLATLRGALYEGSLDFERQAQAGTALRSALAELLWGAALDPEKQSFTRQNLYKALIITAPPEVVFSLPLDPQTRRLLQRVDRTLLLGELLPTSASAGDSVISAELSALDRMRLIAMQVPVHRRRIVPTEAPEPPRSTDSRRTPTCPAPTTTRTSQSTILESTVAQSISRFSSR